jgi:hypothetical protein
MISSKYLSMCWVSKIKTTTRKVSMKGPRKVERISLSIFFMRSGRKLIKNKATLPWIKNLMAANEAIKKGDYGSHPK